MASPASAFTSRGVSIAGRVPRLQSYTSGSESGQPELAEGLRTGGGVHDPIGLQKVSPGGELHLTFFSHCSAYGCRGKRAL